LRIRRIALLSLLLFSVIAAFPVHALPANSMWIEPSTIDLTGTTPIGYKFNVTVWLNVTDPTNSWQFYVVYNKQYLNASRLDYTGSGKSMWAGTWATDSVLPSFDHHNTTHDFVLHGEVLKASAENTGSGSLSWVEFEVIQKPPEGETVTLHLALDVSGVFESTAMDKSFVPLTLSFGEAQVIIPEFPLAVLLIAFFVVASTIAVVFRKKIVQTSHLRNH